MQHRLLIIILTVVFIVAFEFAALSLIHRQSKNTNAIKTLCGYFVYQAQLLKLQTTNRPVGDTAAKERARLATLGFEELFLKKSC